MLTPLLLFAVLQQAPASDAPTTMRAEVELRGGYLGGSAIEGVRAPTHSALRGGLAQLAGKLSWGALGVALTASFGFFGRPFVGTRSFAPARSQSLDVAFVVNLFPRARLSAWFSAGSGYTFSNSYVHFGETEPQRGQRAGVATPVLTGGGDLHLQLRVGARAKITERWGASVTGELRTCDWYYSGDALGTCNAALAVTAGPSFRF